MFEILAQVQRVIDELLPEPNSPAFRNDTMLHPLTSKNLKHSLPEAVINVLNKVYSRRFDFER